ncbi:MAG: hypothetical protein CSA09_05380 [Candidatus Contendobacter odensis]|uniref:TIR domain-containing protein n=1 Tax=Candidatus Contendibacter odensensis TaxID=1400860 RepID=A0A2G6PDU0_9GAMM|nr:MAG: hypothetical protein CSA09_05380 [Candidatus Contendobacter odensis]
MTAASIFVCHARADDAFAQDLYLALETCRLSVWRDTRGLRDGGQLSSEVRWAIENAQQVIVVIGLNSSNCPWIRREIEMAQEIERRRGGSFRVIPLLLPGVDATHLDEWFTPLPRTAPIQLAADGLGAVLPQLLAVLERSLPGDIERITSSWVALELYFNANNTGVVRPWQLTARLRDSSGALVGTELFVDCVSLPAPLPARVIRWYLNTHPLWPTDTVRRLARRIDNLLANWGQHLYQSTLGMPECRELIDLWQDNAELRERHLTIYGDTTLPGIAAIIDLPWELLHDGQGFLIQNKRPVQVHRCFNHVSKVAWPAPPPLRILATSPRPDTEPTGHRDYRYSVLPMLEAASGMGRLIEAKVLSTPTRAILEKQLNDAWAAGRPITVLHLDGFFHAPANDADICFAFESSYELHAPLCRTADFVPVSGLAALLATYRVELVSFVAPWNTKINISTLAEIFIQAGVTAVMVTHPDTPSGTLQRFWSAFYEELLRGLRLSQALFAGQRRLAGDSYRAQGLGGGGVYLLDWFGCRLYLGDHDPRLALRPPIELWRRLQGQSRLESLPDTLPAAPASGCLGRGRELLIIERLLESDEAVFLRGPGGIGKSVAMLSLTHWLMHCKRYHKIAYVCGSNVTDVRSLLEALGQQLLPEGERWSVDRYPTRWQAQEYMRQHMRQILHERSLLIILDQIDKWPSDNDTAFEQFWRELVYALPKLHLLAVGRSGPPFFAQPWKEALLAPLDDEDAIRLISRTLIAADEIPPSADSGSGFSELRRVLSLVGGHPGALRELAHLISIYGVKAAWTKLRLLYNKILRYYKGNPQWPLYLSIEMALQRLPETDRQHIPIVAFFKEGVNRITLGRALGRDTLATDQLANRLIELRLAEDQGYGHLQIDPAFSYHQAMILDKGSRASWRERWRDGMEYLLGMLYQQYFKDNARTVNLLKLELPNLLALLRDSQTIDEPYEVAQLAGKLEQLFSKLGSSSALAEVVSARERASLALQGWSRIRFETERLRIERLRDEGSLEEALQTTRQLLQQVQNAGVDAYAGAAYDLAHTHFMLGKLLKLVDATEAAIRELSEARRQFQALANAGNSSAGRMAAVADAENGDCLADLQRLQDAVDAYEAALAQAGADSSNPMVATNRLQLGLVLQRQRRYSEAEELYDSARRAYENLGNVEGAAQSWRQLGLVRKMSGELESALHACQQALYLYEQQRNRAGIAEVLSDLGGLYQSLEQFEAAALAYRRMAEIYLQLGDNRGEEASRNKLANVLILLRRHDEARQELYRASECSLPDSPTARHWAIRRGMHDVGQSVQDIQVAGLARRQAMQKYLAYRKAGGENNNPGARLCAQIGQAIHAGDVEPMLAKLAQIRTSTNIPAAGQLLIDKLQAILNGDRDPALAADLDLHYQYAVELQILLEDLSQAAK